MKIPKIVFQTSIIKPPKYLVEQIQEKCEGWTYYHFKDADIIQFIQDNPLQEFENSVALFNSMINGAHKADFFRYYFLYVKGGVYIDSDAMLEEHIENIVKDYSFFTVKSLLNNSSMFNGFIGCEPNHIIIHQALKDMYNMNITVLKEDYFYVCKKLFNIIDDNNRLLQKFGIINADEKIFTEKIFNEDIAITIDDDNPSVILLKHYFTKTIIPSRVPIEERQLKSVKRTKIGITLDIPKNLAQLFSNGIKQNVLYFGELLLNIGYDCYFIIDDKKVSDLDKKVLYDDRFSTINHTDILDSNFDVVIIMGYELENNIIETIKYTKTKLVAYFCGNSYLIDSETILYSQHKNRSTYRFVDKNKKYVFDQIWSIPQMTNTNKYYWQTLYRCPCIEVPFIWSSKAIELSQVSENIDTVDQLLYTNRGENKKIVIFEPNISIMKWVFPALLVCENAYRNNKNIDKVFMNNITNKPDDINIFNLDKFNIIVKSLDLFADAKLSIESRYNSLFFMSKYADIVVSHQWENPLNYLYLDLAWMGWPIVHNAHLCKDIGYYYEEFNYDMGGQIVTDVILNHDANSSEYLEKNRKIIDRYLPSNKALQNQYKILVNQLF